MTKALEIVGRFGKVDNTIDYQNNKDIQNRHKIYTHRLQRFLPKLFIYLENKDLTRTLEENLGEEECNMGNLLVIVKEIAISNPIVKERIGKPLKKCLIFKFKKSKRALRSYRQKVHPIQFT